VSFSLVKRISDVKDPTTSTAAQAQLLAKVDDDDDLSSG
jgi:hypothetical protein